MGRASCTGPAEERSRRSTSRPARGPCWPGCRGGGARLYLVNADGSNVRVLLDDADLVGMAWSPDGTRLAYADSSGDRMRIFTQTGDGAAPFLVGEAARAGALFGPSFGAGHGGGAP